MSRIASALAGVPRLWLAIGGLAFALYLPAIHWGAPHATGPERVRSWGVDDETPLGPLAEMHNIIEPRQDRNLGYPLMYPFLVVAGYAPYFAFLAASGGFEGGSGDYPFGLRDPVSALRHLTWIAHLISALLAAMAAVATADAARTMLGQRAGLLAGVMAALSFPVVYYARTGNPDAAMLAFTAMALAAYARIAEGGVTTGRVAALGVFVGFAVATKEQAAAAFLGIPVVLAVMHLREQGGDRSAWRQFAFWRAPLLLIVAATLAFGFGSGLFVDPDRYLAHLAFGRERLAEVARGEVAFVSLNPFTWAGHLAQARQLLGYLSDVATAPGLTLAVAGMAFARWRERRALLFAVPLATYVLVLFFSARHPQLRYLILTVPPLAFFAALALDKALASPLGGTRAVGAALTVLVVGGASLKAIELTHQMVHDSRFTAGEWLATHAQAGDRIDFFGLVEALPPLAADVLTEHATPFLGGAAEPRLDFASVRQIRERWRRQRPEFIVLVPDYTSYPGRSFSASCPDQIYLDLMQGTMGYRLAIGVQTDPLFPWLTMPALDYPTVNPPVHVFAREDLGRAFDGVEGLEPGAAEGRAG